MPIDLLPRVLLKEIIYRACALKTEQDKIRRSQKEDKSERGRAGGNEEGNEEICPPLGYSPVASS